MAIPFNLPSDEETEDNYRRLEQLLIDLLDLLRQILLRRTVYRPSQNSGEDEQDEPEDGVVQSQEEPARVVVLPDIVPESMTQLRKPVPVVLARRRRRRQEKGHPNHHQQRQTGQQQQQQQTPQSFLNLGIELRQIAEEFTFSSRGNDGSKKKRRELKASSLLSVLVPAPFSRSLWTTVIIIVGWRILSRQR